LIFLTDIAPRDAKAFRKPIDHRMQRIKISSDVSFHWLICNILVRGYKVQIFVQKRAKNYGKAKMQRWHNLPDRFEKQSD
jgi:hypothetical protein